MPLFDEFIREKHILNNGLSRLMVSHDKFLVWNNETEVWELPAKARWMECGEWLAINRVCTKLLGHGGPHGAREQD